MRITTNILDYLPVASRSEARQFLEWIGAYERNVGVIADIPEHFHLGPILNELEAAMPYVTALAETCNLSHPIFDIAEATLQELKHQAKLIPSATKDYRTIWPPKKSGRLMHGYLTSLPVYSLLPYKAQSATGNELLTKYKAVLLVIKAELEARSANESREYSSSINGAATSLRLLTKMPVIEWLPDVLVKGIEATILDLEQIKAGERYSINQDELAYINSLTVVLRYFQKGRGTSERSNGSRDTSIPIDPIENDDGKKTSVVRPVTKSKEEIREVKISGISVNELADDLEYITDEADPDEEAAEEIVKIDIPNSIAQQAMSRRWRLEAIERNAQALPGMVTRLHSWEIALFIRMMKDATQDSSDKTWIEAAAALNVMFWMSKKLSEALRLKIYQSADNLPDHIPKGFLGYLQNSKEWVVQALRPKGEPAYRDINMSSAVDVVPLVKLPDHVGVWKFLRKLPSWQLAARSGSASAFDKPGAVIESHVKEFLKTAKHSSHGRLTLSRISYALFASAVDLSGDRALASLIFSKPHRASDTQLHYTEAPTNRLRTLYTDMCKNIANAAIDELNALSKSPRRPAALNAAFTTSDESVGCPIRPKEAAIRTLVANLVRELDAVRRSPLDANYLVNFHNLYTVYVILQLQHLTGLRAVKNPIPHVGHIDFEHQILLASDKDDYTSFNTRIVPLTGQLTKQLQLFLAHRRAVLARLFVIESQKIEMLRQKEPKPGLFFLIRFEENNLRILPSSPKFISEQIKRYSPEFGLPENCQRARLRSWLLESSCPPQWIDAMLGHWTRGEEPSHRFSTTAIARICSGVREYLERLERQDGWLAIRGMG
jgi:hypothetical protein